MRWNGKNSKGSLGALSWIVVSLHVDSLVSTSADAGWKGVSNAGKICDMMRTGVVPEFGGGGGSNDKMIQAIDQLSTPESGYGYLFESLSPSQRLCLFTAVLADGRKDALGKAMSNHSIVGRLPEFAAELGFKQRHFKLTDVRFAQHVSEGRSRFVSALAKEIEKAASEAAQ